MSARNPLALAIVTITLASAARAAPPPVVRVVLHPDGAVVTRATDVTCADGTATASFKDLPPVFDPVALRASAAAPAQVQGVAVAQRELTEPHSDEVRALDTQIEQLNAKVLAFRRDVESANAAAARADALRSQTMPFIAREAAMSTKPNTAAWTEALDTLRKQHDAANQRSRAAEKAIRDLQEDLAELQQKRDRLADAAPREAIDADVVVKCEGVAKTRVELTYTTPLASWSPAYEARAEENGVALTVLANAQQRTGEAWTGVEVALSTALSERNAKPPVMQKELVGAMEHKEEKKVLVQRQEQQEHLNEGVAPGQAAGGEFTAEDQGLSVQIKVPGKVELAGNGTPARLRVETIASPAKLGLLTIPKLAPFAYRATEMPNTARYPLVSGPIDLFTGNGFIGTQTLPRTAQNDRARLSFGVDEAVKIRRTVLAEDKLDPGFLGQTRRLVYGYRIELTSNAKAPVTVAVHEPVPVSEIDDVKVAIEKQTTPGFTHVAADGRVEWNVTLQPKEKKTLELHFTIEVPTRYDATGL